jgi:hypothetical protein
MVAEIIAVYSEITAKCMKKVNEQNSKNFDVVENYIYRYLCGLMLENIVLAPVNNFRKN